MVCLGPTVQSLPTQIGTYMYYPSTSMHKAIGGFGAPNIEQRSVISIMYPAHAGDFTLLVGDWYKAGAKALRKKLNSCLDLPLPGGLLINDLHKSSVFTGQKEGPICQILKLRGIQEVFHRQKLSFHAVWTRGEDNLSIIHISCIYLLLDSKVFRVPAPDFFDFLLPKMERSDSLSSLTFKGSIPEAILEAKNQKKLFVVYISGEDSEVENVEDSTWTDLKVKESLSKYCILLHIRGGSTDAANFSSVYPQKSVPCITAIGYNGVQVWRSEGFVSAEVLASSLEKAWLSLHIQETTAAVLSAALASKKYESSSSGASTVCQSEQGSSSSVSIPSTTMADVDRNLEANIAVTSGVIEENIDSENTVQEKNTELVEKSSSESFSADNLADIVDKQCDIINGDTRTVVSSVTSSPAGHASENASSHPEDDCLIPVKGIDHQSSCPSGSSPVSAVEAEKAMQHVKDKGIDDVLENTKTANIPTDVHLNIRLLDSSSLQEKFPVTYTLSMIKDYVDRNQSSGMSPYDLAIPYPRKIFGDQDLSKSLLDLGLLNRQALIVVPHRRPTGFQGQRAFDDDRNLTATEASPGSNGGYFAYLRSFLSYVNPFSYLGGGASSSTTGQESQSGIWEYSPNPTLQNNLSGRNRSTSTAKDDSKNRRPAVTTRYGSNIHTLKRDEDDDRFSDRNPFWNGNSTQYGGSSDSS